MGKEPPIFAKASHATLEQTGHSVTAILGPTNTGKTHLAIERMLAHESGIIGLPLRLLAREVYQRIVDKIGVNKVALITGEEKITPDRAAYSVCTVEALPRHTNVAFVAIDEIQLCADLERGHIFTDRLLHLRGRQETMLLGAATMQDILTKLIRNITIINRPRFSQLLYSGSKKISRLPRRSAIVAFSSDEVYAIAEFIRRQRGGAAVVMGVLSPRTRNAQVALYQNGDVDFLVATDAIGMGLNLDVDHVAFAQSRKFDGYQFRDLTPAEMAQIAGRAGRHMRNGTFGTTGRVLPFEDELVERIETHQFDRVTMLQWRNNAVDFSTLENLKKSLERASPINGLIRALPANDAKTLEYLSRDYTISQLADNRERIALLWDICALPDYRKIAPAQHAEIVATLYGHLIKRGAINENYMAQQVALANHTDGDLDTLSHRIAQIRTWTYVSNRQGWLTDSQHWQEKTREIENRLSDALHERLTKRFIDRRTSILMRRLRENVMMNAEIAQNGDVLVEGHHVGKLNGFRFIADNDGEGNDAKAIKTAAAKALASEFEKRAERLATSANGDFALGSDGVIRWIGQPIASLVASEDILKPRAILLADEQLTGAFRDKVLERIDRFVAYHFETALKPLFDLKNADALIGLTRGIAFQLIERLGVLPRREVAEDLKNLDQVSRAALRRLGVRFGAFHIFLPMMLKPAPAQAVTLLWALKNDGRDFAGYGEVLQVLAAGRTSTIVDPAFHADFYLLAGYRILGRRAVRIDILERLADLIRLALSYKIGVGTRPDGAYDGKHFIVTPAMMSILGATPEDMEEILKSLGYRHETSDNITIAEKLAEIDQIAKSDRTAPIEQSQATLQKAEPVGSDWPIEQATKSAEESATATFIADAEPVGAMFSKKAKAQEAKPVFLWRYQPRFEQRSHHHKRHHHNNSQNHDRQQQAKKWHNTENRQNKNSEPAKHNASEASQGRFHANGDKKEQYRGKKPHFDKNAKHQNAFKNQKPRMADKPIDPDSPFAKLAALREQLKK